MTGYRVRIGNRFVTEINKRSTMAHPDTQKPTIYKTRGKATNVAKYYRQMGTDAVVEEAT